MVLLAGINFSDLGPSNKSMNINKSGIMERIPEYRSVWTARIGEELVAKHENHKAFNRFLIVGTKSLPATIQPFVIGCLPRKVLSLLHYLIIHGGRVLCSVTDAHSYHETTLRCSLTSSFLCLMSSIAHSMAITLL